MCTCTQGIEHNKVIFWDLHCHTMLRKVLQWVTVNANMMSQSLTPPEVARNLTGRREVAGLLSEFYTVWVPLRLWNLPALWNTGFLHFRGFDCAHDIFECIRDQAKCPQYHI